MFRFFGSDKNKKTPALKKLKELEQKCQNLLSEISYLKQELEKVKEERKFFVQKVGFLRFNPFKEQGGDQSFSIALLDGRDNGFVITSIYGQQETRVYAKPIFQGQSSYQLSEEEKKVLEQARTGSLNFKIQNAK